MLVCDFWFERFFVSSTPLSVTVEVVKHFQDLVPACKTSAPLHSSNVTAERVSAIITRR